jgi:hypothetical protein
VEVVATAAEVQLLLLLLLLPDVVPATTMDLG